MDAAKGQYMHWLPQILRLLPSGGVLLSDNVLQDGDIVESAMRSSAATGRSTRGCAIIYMN